MVPLSVPRKCAVLLEPVEDVEPHGARPPLALAEGLFAVQEGGGDIDIVVRGPDTANLARRTGEPLASVQPEPVATDLLEATAHVFIEVREDRFLQHLLCVPCLQRGGVGEDEPEVEREERIVQVETGVAGAVPVTDVEGDL